ncbi:hypothetical protein M747DRAFT_27968 [Aspergillus niger ATCC 13496]|uniref:Uncharacterized protein n=1 Tax=Aspergillus niger ATCC 13496 TaxID=1353008 RepID=A0A370BZ37_ASPNG|nr:hypothetical protein M747DRAFT_27968 [Aspergillus niger ATCC 13496]
MMQQVVGNGRMRTSKSLGREVSRDEQEPVRRRGDSVDGRHSLDEGVLRASSSMDPSQLLADDSSLILLGTMCNPRVLKLGNLSRSKCEFILSKCSSASLVGRHAEIATGFKPVLTSPPADRNLESPVFPICVILQSSWTLDSPEPFVRRAGTVSLESKREPAEGEAQNLPASRSVSASPRLDLAIGPSWPHRFLRLASFPSSSSHSWSLHLIPAWILYLAFRHSSSLLLPPPPPPSRLHLQLSITPIPPLLLAVSIWHPGTPLLPHPSLSLDHHPPVHRLVCAINLCPRI